MGIPSLHVLLGDNFVDTFHAENFKELGLIRMHGFSELTVYTLAEAIVNALSWAKENKHRITELGKPYRTVDALQRLVDIAGNLYHEVE